MREVVHFFDEYKGNATSIKVFLWILSLAATFCIAMIFFYTPDLRYWKSLLIVQFLISAFGYFVLKVVSPFLARKSSILMTLVSLCIFIGFITALLTCIFEYGLVEYPTIIQEEILPLNMKVAFFMICGIALYFTARSLHLFLNTFQLTDSRLEFLKNSFQKEIDEMRIQSNPNFLLQSLQNIDLLISIDQEQNAIKYASAISELLKNQLIHTQSDQITVEQDIEWIEYYLQTQKIIFKDDFEYSIELKDNDVLLQKIPPLLFQPILESLLLTDYQSLKKHSVKITIDDISTTKTNGIEIHFSAHYEDITFQKNQNSISLIDLKKRIELINNLQKFNIQLLEKHNDAYPIYILKILELSKDEYQN